MVNLMPAVILANIKGYHNIPSFLPFIFFKFLQTDLCVILILEDEIRPKLMLMGKIAAKPLYLQSMIYLKRHHLNSAMANGSTVPVLLSPLHDTPDMSRGHVALHRGQGKHATPPLICAKVCKPLQNFLGKVVTSDQCRSELCVLSFVTAGLGWEAVAASCCCV